MDGVSPWEWTVDCRGDYAGCVISGTMITTGEGDTKQKKQQKKGGLISKLAEEEFLMALAYILFPSMFSFRVKKTMYPLPLTFF